MQIFRSAAFALTAWASLAGIAHAAPSLSLTPADGSPSTPVTASVSGFSGSSSVNVFFDTTNSCTIHTDSAGAGSCTFTMPETALPQQHQVAAKLGNEIAKATLPVRVNWGQFHGITPAQNGFNNYENVITAGNVGTLKPRWRVLKNIAVSNAPVVANGIIYVTAQNANTNGVLYAFNAVTGAPIAKFPKLVAAGVPLSPPVVAGGIVYVASNNSGDSQLYAFNANTGAKINGFPVPIGGAGVAAPTVAAGKVFQPSGDGQIYGFNAKTGAELPNFPISAAGNYISTAASYADVTTGGQTVHELCVGAGDGFLYCFDTATGDQIFAFGTDSGFFDIGGPAISGGVLYFVSWSEHIVHAVDPATGTEKWTNPVVLPQTSDSTPAIANGQVVVGDNSGTLYSIKAATGTVTWKVKLGSPIDGSAVIARGVIYVNTSTKLFAINAATGATLWQTANPTAYGQNPVVVNGTVYATSNAGTGGFGLSAFTRNGAPVSSVLPGGDAGVAPADSALTP